MRLNMLLYTIYHVIPFFVELFVGLDWIGSDGNAGVQANVRAYACVLLCPPVGTCFIHARFPSCDGIHCLCTGRHIALPFCFAAIQHPNPPNHHKRIVITCQTWKIYLFSHSSATYLHRLTPSSSLSPPPTVVFFALVPLLPTPPSTPHLRTRNSATPHLPTYLPTVYIVRTRTPLPLVFPHNHSKYVSERDDSCPPRG